MDEAKNIYADLIKQDSNFAGYVNEEKTEGMFGQHISIFAISKLTRKEIMNTVKKYSNAVDIQLDLIKQNIPEHQGRQQGDEVKTLFMGSLPTEQIVDNQDFKIENPDGVANVKEWYREFRYLAPIILDRNLKVIDGHVRLEIAQKSRTKYIAVVIINAEPVKAKALRLGLNRSCEFARWNYDEVDPFVDSKPELQPILEPIGFFSNEVLPDSFFSNTIINYKEDPYNDQMQSYIQDKGLLEWASLIRKRQQTLEANRKQRQEDYSRHSGLLQLKYTKDDLLETEDVKEAFDSSLSEVTKIAADVTEEFDRQRKPVIRAKGLEWQHSKRNTKQLAADKRKEAKEKAKQKKKNKNKDKETR